MQSDRFIIFRGVHTPQGYLRLRDQANLSLNVKVPILDIEIKSSILKKLHAKVILVILMRKAILFGHIIETYSILVLSISFLKGEL